MALSSITDLENAIERTELQKETLFMSSFTSIEKDLLEGIYKNQIIIYRSALNRLKGANEIEVINPETIE